jgi:hypothetical protein
MSGTGWFKRYRNVGVVDPSGGTMPASVVDPGFVRIDNAATSNPVNVSNDFIGKHPGMADMSLRQTVGIVDRIESNGFGVIHEVASNKPGFFSNETLLEGRVIALNQGSRVSIRVEDKNDLLVVRSIDLA